MEMLPGTFPGAHNYKCFLKAGHDVQPEKYADKTAVYCFTAGKGYVTTDKFARNITELAFFVPDFDNGDFTIHAVEDLEFLCRGAGYDRGRPQKLCGVPHNAADLPFLL